MPLETFGCYDKNIHEVVRSLGSWKAYAFHTQEQNLVEQQSGIIWFIRQVLQLDPVECI